jgi:hypothetical protein
MAVHHHHAIASARVQRLSKKKTMDLERVGQVKNRARVAAIHHHLHPTSVHAERPRTECMHAHARRKALDTWIYRRARACMHTIAHKGTFRLTPSGSFATRRSKTISSLICPALHTMHRNHARSCEKVTVLSFCGRLRPDALIEHVLSIRPSASSPLPTPAAAHTSLASTASCRTILAQPLTHSSGNQGDQVFCF